MYLDPSNPKHVHHFVHRVHVKGKGFSLSSFLNKAKTIAANTAKQVAKKVKDVGKVVGKKVLEHGKELGKNLVDKAVEHATQMAVEHGTQLLGDIASGKDIKQSFQDRGKAIKEDFKSRGKDLLSEAKHGVKQAGLNVITDTIGIDRIPVQRPVSTSGETIPEAEVMEEEDVETGEGVRRGRKHLSQLLAKAESRKSKKGGSAFVPHGGGVTKSKKGGSAFVPHGGGVKKSKKGGSAFLPTTHPVRGRGLVPV
jgi:hypothetical protein